MARKPFSPSEIDTRTIVGNKPYSRFVILLIAVVSVLAVLFILSGFGSRWGWWHFSTGFTIMMWTAYGGAALAIISAITLFRLSKMRHRRGGYLAVISLIISALLFIIPFGMQQFAGNFPPIHDITTDTDNPPEFVEVVPLREDAPNPPEYEGEEVAEQQHQYYPDLESLTINRSAEDAFSIALEAAQNMRNWEIVGYQQDEGRIEATATTFWYGFKDDVVIRLEEENDIVVLDVRSKSRVGMGDLGVNARRIQRYLDRVNDQM